MSQDADRKVGSSTISAIDAHKQSINYQTAAQRRACCNCAHANLQPIGSRTEWRCWFEHIHFDTSALAVCGKHEFKGEKLKMMGVLG